MVDPGLYLQQDSYLNSPSEPQEDTGSSATDVDGEAFTASTGKQDLP